MPTEIGAHRGDLQHRLVRLTAVRKSVVQIWKIAQMTTRPTSTGSEPEVALGQPRGGVAATSADGQRLGCVGCSIGVGRRSVDRRCSSSASPRCAEVGAGDRGDDLLARWSLARRSSATRRPSRSTTIRSATSNTSARLWLITTTPSLLAQPPDQVEHLRGLGDAERGGRLVEHHDLGVSTCTTGDRHGLALPAGERRRPRCARSGS